MRWSRRAAAAAIGGLDQVKQDVRDARVGAALDAGLLDLRQAWRSLRNAPGLTAVIVITLALGIGANTAIFSVVRGVMLKPLPHREGDRLMYLRQSADGPGRENVAFSVPEINDFRSTSR
ncbi:MAG: hypothetical protein ABR611_16220, partial [Chthoniobacterales bacterium]